MKVERIESIGRFAELREQWNQLKGGEGLSSPAFTHEWFSAWLEAFGAGTELTVTVLFDGPRLVGAAPLCLSRRTYRGISCRQLRLLYNRHGPRCTFLLRDGHEASAGPLLEEALRLPGWDVAVFENVPHGSYLYRAFTGWVGAWELPVLVRRTMDSPFLKIEGSWDEFFDSRSRSLKRSLRRKESRLTAAGRMTIEHVTDAARARGLMETLFAVGERSWKARRGRAIGSGSESKAFYTRLAEEFGSRGEVSVWLMRIDGKPVAFEFHIVRDGTVQALRAEFDEEHRELGVGSVLDKEIVRRLFESGFKEYDMGGEADFYKLRWSETTREHSELLVFNSSAKGRLLRAIEQGIVEPMKKVTGPFSRGRDVR
ncbi:MAG: GNAT family N-acetyltransferase [Candidatus Eiseniibacteriota bacterium]|nr:MAG: GNAT family N-acetyltransferase [Candidatus Eisenbacteria bacterium]